MKQIKPKFNGKIDGHELKRAEWVDLPSETVSRMNPMSYRTRPLTPEPKTINVQLEITSSKNGWHTLWKGKTKVFSSRELTEVEEKKKEIANNA